MAEYAIITSLREAYKKLAGPEATLSALPLAALRALVGNHLRTRINGYELKIDLRDTVIGFQILTQHKYEPRQTALLRSLLGSSDFVVDAGANIGYYAVMFGGVVAPSGRVIAVEADPENAQLLRENVELNRLSGVVSVIEAAAGAGPGTATLYRVNVGNRGDSHLFSEAATAQRRTDRQQVRVPVTTIDECTKDWPRVDVVKLDVQGYENQVLSGMQAVLAKNPGLILVTEFWPWGMRRSGDDPREFVARLRSLGFALWEVPEEHPVRPFEWSTVDSLGEEEGAFTNILCARLDRQAKRLRAAGVPTT